MNGSADIALTTPESVASDPNAIEMLRFWWSHGEPVMAIKPAFIDPAVYGRMLVIAARNIAHVYSTNQGRDEEATYQTIIAEMRHTADNLNFTTIAEPSTKGSAQ